MFGSLPHGKGLLSVGLLASYICTGHVWAEGFGVVEKAIINVAHPSAMSAAWWWVSFLGSWVFIIESVIVNVAYLDEHAMSAIWWWVLWSVSALLVSLTMSMLWAWDSPGILYSGGGRDGGMGWWWLMTSSGRCWMVVVEMKRCVAQFVTMFLDLAGAEKGICEH